MKAALRLLQNSFLESFTGVLIYCESLVRPKLKHQAELLTT